jgi:predicted TIM-barrel fold metal-dependent hydrolase
VNNAGLKEHLTLRSSSLERREFLAGLAALGSAALIPGAVAAPQTKGDAGSRLFRVDTHHHFTVPGLRSEVAKAGQQALLDWTPQTSLDDMEKGGVATAILSVGDPGLWFGNDDAARKLARECNDYSARLMRDYPGRFGMFAALPLPDVDGALRELEYALDTLHADGVCVLSSYQGRYLGNEHFKPLMDELNRRKALVYCHPLCAACASQPELKDGQARGVEFVIDTTRTILSVLVNGTVTRCPDIRFIWSHGGGTVPYITSRLAGAAPNLPKGLIYELQKFYYDTAQAFSPYTLPSFKKLVPVSHMVFGTDFPLGNGSSVPVAKGLIENGGFTASELRAIDRDNAAELIPRLKTLGAAKA